MLYISCGSIVEFYSEALEGLQNKICKEKGFKGITHTLEIKGYGANCRKTKQQIPSPIVPSASNSYLF
jgi:Fe2+ or Zn2+ uptake regulation protein